MLGGKESIRLVAETVKAQVQASILRGQREDFYHYKFNSPQLVLQCTPSSECNNNDNHLSSTNIGCTMNFFIFIYLCKV